MLIILITIIINYQIKRIDRNAVCEWSHIIQAVHITVDPYTAPQSICSPISQHIAFQSVTNSGYCNPYC
jgi:hypothetical protein